MSFLKATFISSGCTLLPVTQTFLLQLVHCGDVSVSPVCISRENGMVFLCCLERFLDFSFELDILSQLAQLHSPFKMCFCSLSYFSPSLMELSGLGLAGAKSWDECCSAFPCVDPVGPDRWIWRYREVNFLHEIWVSLTWIHQSGGCPVTPASRRAEVSASAFPFWALTVNCGEQKEAASSDLQMPWDANCY